MGKSTKRIKLSGKKGEGKFTLVDAEDYDFLSQWKWFVNCGGYASRTYHSPRPKRYDKTIFMHRVINNTPPNMYTDHINRNKLDNRKSNLRAVTNTQNQLNKGLQKNNVTGFVGVTKRPNGKWWARIYVGKKMISLGCYLRKKDAIIARKMADLRYWHI